MSDLTPPEQPLDDATRARIRARVAAGAASSGEPARSSRPRPWLVPLAASAAVGALVVGVVALGGDDEPDAVGPAAPVTTPPVDSPPTGEPTATEVPTDPDPTDLPSVPGFTRFGCEREVRQVLRGARETVSIEDDQGTTVFYVADGRYTLCHENGEVVTVHHPKPLAGGGDRNPYELSTDLADDGGATFVAGGPVPAGSPDFAVDYTFADGGVASSTTAGSPPDELWWLVVHRADDGVAAIDGPITVDVRNGPPATPLDVLDTCAQANHGC